MSAHPERNAILTGVVIALVVSSVIGYVVRRRYRSDQQAAETANLSARIRTWWMITALLTVAFLAGTRAVVLLFGLVSFASLREFLTIIPSRSADRIALLAAFLAVLPIQYYLVWRGRYATFALFIPVYTFLVLPILTALRADTKSFLARIAETQWAVMISVYCISYVPALLTMHITGQHGDQIGNSGNRSALLAVFLILVVQSSDVSQYAFGKLFGRLRIAPSLSPSKTVEGFLAGMICAAILGIGLGNMTPFPRWQAAAIALLIALMGFFSGLVMSAIKRDRGIKDWGHFMPGHGGMLDRLDSICFSAPVFFYLTRYLLGT